MAIAIIRRTPPLQRDQMRGMGAKKIVDSAVAGCCIKLITVISDCDLGLAELKSLPKA